MMYFAVARDGHDGGAQITASHNPKQYNGIKLVRREAFPLSGEAGLGEIRDMIAAGTIPAPARPARDALHEGRPRRLRPARDVVHRSVDRQAVQRRARRGERHGGPGRPEAVRAAAVPDDDAVLRDRRDVSEPRSQPAHRGKPPRHRRARRPGPGRHRDRVGRRRRSVLLHRRHRRVHRRRLRDGAARRGVPAAGTRAPRSSTTSAPATPSRTWWPSTAARR